MLWHSEWEGGGEAEAGRERGGVFGENRAFRAGKCLDSQCHDPASSASSSDSSFLRSFDASFSLSLLFLIHSPPYFFHFTSSVAPHSVTTKNLCPLLSLEFREGGPAVLILSRLPTLPRTFLSIHAADFELKDLCLTPMASYSLPFAGLCALHHPQAQHLHFAQMMWNHGPAHLQLLISNFFNYPFIFLAVWAPQLLWTQRQSSWSISKGEKKLNFLKVRRKGWREKMRVSGNGCLTVKEKNWKLRNKKSIRPKNLLS